jgi:hypothetical protein
MALGMTEVNVTGIDEVKLVVNLGLKSHLNEARNSKNRGTSASD